MKLKLPQKNPQKRERILEGGGFFWLARIYTTGGCIAKGNYTEEIRSQQNNNEIFNEFI